MSNKWRLTVVGITTVLLFAQVVHAGPTTNDATLGTANLTVCKYVSVWIPDGPGDGVQDHAYGMTVTPDYLGTDDPVQTLLQIHALSNCGTWFRVPATLALQDHGSYEAQALVTLESTGGMATKSGGYWYQRFPAAISPGKRVLNATVTVTKHPWTAADLAGYYWQTLWVDVQASSSPTNPGGWPVHTEPTVPPHS